MNAVEFVRKFGWEYAKHILSDDAPLVMDLDYNELKSLVESWELVNLFHDLKTARRILNIQYKAGNKKFKLTQKGHIKKEILCEKLEQAIADVESVGGGV